MDTKKGFHGPRAKRFQSLPNITGSIGPGEYEIDQQTSLTTQVLQKPTSELGVLSPPIGKYEHKSFLDDINSRITSRREYMNSGAEKSGMEVELKSVLRNVPGPGDKSVNERLYKGTYDINYAVGRHVANDDKFSLYKSQRMKWRDQINRDQLTELRKLLGAKDLFTDKRACRRMAHLALYFPA